MTGDEPPRGGACIHVEALTQTSVAFRD